MADTPELPSLGQNEQQEVRHRFEGRIRRAELSDIPHLDPILQEWIRDRYTGELIPEEIADVLNNVQESIENPSPEIAYFVAESNDGRVLGMLGTKQVDSLMLHLAETQHPIELTNAYVAGASRGHGMGRELFNQAALWAGQNGYTETIWNSGPRYAATAWGFYNHYYDRLGVLEHFYGPGGDAPVWHQVL